MYLAKHIIWGNEKYKKAQGIKADYEKMHKEIFL
jgi:hypothetical protein